MPTSVCVHAGMPPVEAAACGATLILGPFHKVCCIPPVCLLADTLCLALCLLADTLCLALCLLADTLCLKDRMHHIFGNLALYATSAQGMRQAFDKVDAGQVADTLCLMPTCWHTLPYAYLLIHSALCLLADTLCLMPTC
jgi:hypothetical protein